MYFCFFVRIFFYFINGFLFTSIISFYWSIILLKVFFSFPLLSSRITSFISIHLFFFLPFTVVFHLYSFIFLSLLIYPSIIYSWFFCLYTILQFILSMFFYFLISSFLCRFKTKTNIVFPLHLNLSLLPVVLIPVCILYSSLILFSPLSIYWIFISSVLSSFIHISLYWYNHSFFMFVA